jgi:AcrR family transcriptional regulator
MKQSVLIVSLGQASYSLVGQQESAGSGSASGGRRTQAERSARTRERLLDAALACLAERGWSGTTTVMVAERAGVSRGAQLHHFPTRQALVAAAVHHLAERRLEEFGRAVAELPDDRDLVSAGIELIWQFFSDPTADALLELLVAARTDQELRESLAPVAARIDQRFAEATRALLPEPLASDSRLTTLRNVTFLLLQGLSVSQIVRNDPASPDEVLAFLRDLARRTFVEIQKESS